MEIIGYIFSIAIGVSLGLIGGGGSILTVPVLVYIFKIDAVTATGYSLFIVGLTALIGSITYFKNNLVNIKTAVNFGVPSIISVLLTRAYILPAIPNEIITVGEFVITKSIMLMLLFAILMILASYNMIKKPTENVIGKIEDNKSRPFLISIQGFATGCLTGLVGVGGGFLIIPALVLLSKLPMKIAIGTSLVIIAANSLIGFAGGIKNHDSNWTLILSISAFAIIGIFIGSYLSKKIDGSKLKPAFGWFILVMGIYIILKETLLK